MNKSFLLISALLIQLAGVCGNDSTKMHARFEIQLRTGYYYAWIANNPPPVFNATGDHMQGIQLSPGLGVSLNWKWTSLGLNASFFSRIDPSYQEGTTYGLIVMATFDLATWNSGTPVGLRIYGGIMPFGFVSHDPEDPGQATVPAYFIGLAPVFRLNHLNSRATFLLGPSVEYTIGQYWNKRITFDSKYRGTSVSYEYPFEYTSISLNILFIVKFNNPVARKKPAGQQEKHRPFSPFPPFPSR